MSFVKEPLSDEEEKKQESNSSFPPNLQITERANLTNNNQIKQNQDPSSSESDRESSIESTEIMESSMRIPPPLIFEGNIKERWTRWKQKFLLYLTATGLSEKSEERNVAVL